MPREVVKRISSSSLLVLSRPQCNYVVSVISALTVLIKIRIEATEGEWREAEGVHVCLPQLVIVYKYLQPSSFSGSYATCAVFLLQLNELVLPIYLHYVSRGYLRFF